MNRTIMLCSLLLAAGGAFTAEQFALVKNGKAVSCIVTGGEKLNDADAYAALELADYLEKVTGARPEIRQTPAKGCYPIYIGGGSLAGMPRNVAAKRASVRDDGYLLAGTPEGAFLWSKEPSGVIFGAYEILKRCAGVRWFYPGEDGEHIEKRGDVFLPAMILVDNPAMRNRSFNHVCANIHTDQAARRWLLRNRMSAKWRFGSPRHGGGHVFSTLLPDTLYRTNPELFGLYKGKRLPQCGNPSKITKTGKGGQANQPCTSNPETVRIMKENLIREIGMRNLTSFNIMNNDSTAWCECENCRRLDPPDERKNGLVSTRFWLLANELIEAGRSVFPDLRFDCSAYQNYQMPPQGVKPDTRATVTYCVHHRCYTHSVGDPSCRINQRTRDILEAWNKAGLRVSTYEYTNCLPSFEVQYLPLEKVVADDLKYYGSRNNSGYCDEVPPKDAVFGKRWNTRAITENWRSNFLTHYIQAYFMWNPRADFETVLNDIGSRFYGAAWKEIGEYRRLLRNAYSSVNAHFMYGTSSAALGMVLQDKTLKTNLEALLAAAARKVENDPLRRERVRLEKEYFELTFVKSAEIYAAQQSAPCIAKRLHGKIKTDGRLDEKDWADAVPVSGFLKFLGKGLPAKHQTTVRAAYDDENLYLAVEALEPEPGKMIAESAERDDPVWKDNNLELFFAPPAFGAGYIHWSVNHRGTVYDTKSYSPTDRDLAFNLKADAGIAVSGDRWTVELKIPFSELGGAPAKGASWAVNIARGRQVKDSPDNEGSSWSHEGRFHGPEGFRRIKFD